MPPANGLRTRFEGSAPILNVTDMSVNLRYYVAVLGFQNAAWGTVRCRKRLGGLLRYYYRQAA
jgi:hypothetical protein